MRSKAGQVRGEAKREAVLAAAWDVFREAGYPGASMDEITRRAGGSKMSVYSHFGGKAALFEAVVRWKAQAVADSYPVANAASTDMEAAMVALATAIVAGMTAADVRDLHRVALSARPLGPEVGTILFEQGTLRVVRAVAAAIDARMKAGELKADDPVAAAELLFGLLLGTDYIRFALGVPRRLAKAARRERVARAVRVFLAAYRSAGAHRTLADRP